MKRIAKPAGAYNIVVEEVETPAITSTEILIRAECSLISRGSEIWRRYVREEAIDHRSMGYSLVGRVAEVGAEVEEFQTGDLVAALAPHAEYVAVEVAASRHQPAAVRLPAGSVARGGHLLAAGNQLGPVDVGDWGRAGRCHGHSGTGLGRQRLYAGGQGTGRGARHWN